MDTKKNSAGKQQPYDSKGRYAASDDNVKVIRNDNNVHRVNVVDGPLSANPGLQEVRSNNGKKLDIVINPINYDVDKIKEHLDDGIVPNDFILLLRERLEHAIERHPEISEAYCEYTINAIQNPILITKVTTGEHVTKNKFNFIGKLRGNMYTLVDVVFFDKSNRNKNHNLILSMRFLNRKNMIKEEKRNIPIYKSPEYDNI